jgi:CsoR family transcriptional regulator, copper-sensing transcriptional repressor
MGETVAHGNHSHQRTKEVVDRLARIEGHVRAVKGMVEKGRPCPDVLIQLAAVRAALEQVSKVVLADHVESCLRGAAASGQAEAEWESLKEALDRYIS